MTDTPAPSPDAELVTCPRAARLHSPLRYCPDCPEDDACELSAASPTAVVEEGLVEACRAMCWQAGCIANTPSVQCANGCSASDKELLAEYGKLAAAALSASRARIEAEVIGWQPIETAPKDGAEILLLAHGMAIQARYAPGRWSDETPNHPAEYDGAVWVAFDDAVQFEIEEGAGESGQDFHGQVTHWRPLPEPPLPITKAEERDNG